MWTLTIECAALLCIMNPTPAPAGQREFKTYQECDRALMRLATDWKPAAAWKMNCVQR